MHLQQSKLYDILEESHSENSLTAKIHIHEAHEIFKGHFAHQPILPGVCMLQISKELLEQHYQTKLLMAASGQIKFLKMVDPRNDADISISISKLPEQINNEVQFLNIEWKDSEGNYILKLSGGYVVAS